MMTILISTMIWATMDLTNKDICCYADNDNSVK